MTKIPGKPIPPGVPGASILHKAHHNGHRYRVHYETGRAYHTGSYMKAMQLAKLTAKHGKRVYVIDTQQGNRVLYDFDPARGARS